jgi:hypothetical protein
VEEEKARREAEEEEEKEKEKVVVAKKEATDVASMERELVYAGPVFTVAPPDPSQLPMPWLLLSPRYLD